MYDSLINTEGQCSSSTTHKGYAGHLPCFQDPLRRSSVQKRFARKERCFCPSVVKVPFAGFAGASFGVGVQFYARA
ncbi:hypothetical protein BDV98DRAFT_558630 [Pterulicium gracile]|uniref:Uncharacterized protein n=1 Tax=Pterulicium gracile TaxID=1884261 RepID=A0A5C3R0T6_9AGAR|nr:hypothetical protein BDV98DRAFT_558630 [Pterula gracilis]